MSPRPLYVGIDLGTSNSAAALFDGDQVTVVRNARGSTVTPSVVRVDARGSVTVGERARRFLERDPRGTRSEFKRLMGTDTTFEMADGREWRPQDLAAEVIRSLCQDVADQVGEKPTRAVVSIPALFELPQSAATSEAARLAGLEEVELLQEPIASALAAGWRAQHDEGYWLIFDLGGGTFDVSLLETHEGFLRVAGHDGDNFLGGRDFDWALVDHVLACVERDHGLRICRSDPRWADPIRHLKTAAEEARIELSRARCTELHLAGLLADDDIEVTVTVTELEALCAPLVQRALATCHRLLERHRVDRADLRRVVLVGGPTAMPLVRRLVTQELGDGVATGLDPMTLVAQGAALHAATRNLEAAARAVESPAGEAWRAWLHHPAVSSDLTPYVVGRMVEGKPPRPVSLEIVRGDAEWRSPRAAVGEDGGFSLQVSLVPGRASEFHLQARGPAGEAIALSPSSFRVVHGTVVHDVPLSRTIGVALADDTVQVYFERGCPLPTRRTFVHRTVEALARGSGNFLLRIPIVQGELARAHLCRLVGALEIPATHIRHDLTVSSSVEVTLELDGAGCLTARALVPALGQVFEHVAHLLVPTVPPSELEQGLAGLRERVARLTTKATRRGAAWALQALFALEPALDEAERDMRAGRGGDADAAQKARRGLLDLDARLEEIEMKQGWPELEQEATEALAWASEIVSQFGTPPEQKLLEEASGAVIKAQANHDAVELERHLRVVRRLSSAAFGRRPDAWQQRFQAVASRLDEATDLVQARRLVDEGRNACERGDVERLRVVIVELGRLLPADPGTRSQSYGSGVI